MIFLFILLALLLFNQEIHTEKYRVFFKDKGNYEFHKGSDLFERTQKSLTFKSIERRKKVFPSDSFVTYADAPIFDNYLNEISKTGAKILLKLKWLNYIVVEANEQQIKLISKKNFVNFVQPIGEKIPREITNNVNTTNSVIGANKLLFVNELSNDNYGESLNQWKMLTIDKLHSIGILGDSVIFGIIDTGFRWKANKIFQNATVLAEYDFLFQDTITENEEIDTTVQDSHGTMVFSIISGIKEGFLFGGSPFSTFVLAKTEDYRRESHFEEDCFAAALEWMDSIGVDVVSSSLGYSKFDSTESSYSFEDFDGRTTIVSAYANRARNIGITMVSSAGNRGPNDSTIQSPAEAIGEIAIGAVNPTADTVLKFSSRGPTFDGRLKPDFVAQGTNVVCSPAYPFDTVMYGSGTSVAGPIFACGVALLLSAFEELTPNQIYSILKNYSSMKNNPDNSWGYGIVDFYEAALNYDIIISSPVTFYHNGVQRVVFKINHKKEIVSAKIFYRKNNNSEYEMANLIKIPWTNEFYIDLVPSKTDTCFYIYVVAKSIDGQERRKPYYSDKEFEIRVGTNSKNIFVINPPVLNIFPNEGIANVSIFPLVLDYSNELYIKSEELNDNLTNIEIIDLIGNVHFRKRLEINSNELEKIYLGELPKGPYIVKLSTANGFILVSKILKLF
ncbi:MAG: S8 family serine peptidase [Candidatus Kapaibacteriota bacterium]